MTTKGAGLYTVVLHLNSGRNIHLINCSLTLVQQIRADMQTATGKVYDLGSPLRSALLPVRNIEFIEIVKDGEGVEDMDAVFGVNTAGASFL